MKIHNKKESGGIMKAILYEKYGSPNVLKIKEIEKPIPKNNEVLIKVYARTVTSGDVRMRRGSIKSLPLWPISKLSIGFRKPKKNILGWDFAGEVVSVGKDVKKFKKGDEVYGLFSKKGTYVEYISISEKGTIVKKPSNITWEEATSMPFGAITALHFLRNGNIKKGKKVLIYGASGSVGTFAVQIAKYFGTEVTGVCSTGNLDMVKSLGADHVIDYTKEDFSKRGQTYDIIFDTVGKTSFSRSKKVLKPNGFYLLTVFGYKEILQILWTSKIGNKKIIGGGASGSIENLKFLNELIEEGKIKSVIDKIYPFENISEAHEYVEKGHKKGHVVITLD